MIKNLLILALFAITLMSCQFTETMIINEDGTGKMTIEVNLNEMMAFSNEAMTDSVPVKLDTIVYMKQFLEEKKDSISKLPAGEQKKLKAMENFYVNMKMNSETSEMIYSISTDFKNINEANDLLNSLEQAGDLMPNQNSSTQLKKEGDSPEIVGVKYSFNKGVFKRDAYIKDKELHSKEVDSLKETAAFLGSSMYSLNYTFPRKIKRTSNSKATFSGDKKTVFVKESFIEYFKNPDLLDLEVELEN